MKGYYDPLARDAESGAPAPTGYAHTALPCAMCHGTGTISLMVPTAYSRWRGEVKDSVCPNCGEDG